MTLALGIGSGSFWPGLDGRISLAQMSNPVDASSGTFEKTSFQWQIQQQQQRLGEWFESLFSGWDSSSYNSPDWTIPDWFLRGFFWFFVVATLAWLGWQLYPLIAPYIARGWRGGDERSPTPPTTSPYQEFSIAEWVAQSRTAQQQGDYRTACRALYMAMLHHLHDRNLIRQEPGLTDGEYLTRLQRIPQSHPYQLLIRTHERLHFSDTKISAQTCDRCWQAYQEIQS
ncbi:MAG: DUF4129 domain-containing protein [Oculatellaceae cyanobacterium Prado106]|nr:DUF4129 domain-containing protein [Oculatellaceae cyanobacterium Prado106]